MAVKRQQPSDAVLALVDKWTKSMIKMGFVGGGGKRGRRLGSSRVTARHGLSIELHSSDG
jgi:hypothetical protein